MNNLKFAGLVVSLAVLGGCSSTQINENDPGIMKQEVALPDDPGALTGINLPKWFIDTPKDNTNKIYGVGSGLSSDLQFSLDKALHQAKVVVGDKLSNSVSSEIKSYTADNSSIGNATTVEETQRVSKSGFKDVDVSEYEIENRAVYREDNKFRSYIMISINPSSREKDHQTTPIVINQVEVDKARDNARESLDNL